MPAPPEYGPILDEDELDLHVRNMAWSFRAPAGAIRESLRRVGEDRVRVLRVDRRAVGGLTLYPLAQWIGGELLPMTGVNLVGIAPEHRGGGTATRLMEAAVREMRDSGVPLSVLYPAKQTLYRRAGFELAGSRYQNEIPLRDLEFATERDLRLRRYEPDDLAVVQAVHRASCRGLTGPIDRPHFMWQRVIEPVGEREIRGTLVEGQDGCEGYAFVEELAGEESSYRLQLTDLVSVTGRAARRLLRFLGDHASLGTSVSWWGDPRDLGLLAMREQTWRTRIAFRWMLRILDPVAALEKRGYPSGPSTGFDLEIHDPLLPENSGRLRVEVADGRGQVTPGGDGSLRADVRGLAAMYTGYLSPRQARSLGLLDGPDEALARAAACFVGAEPWMADMF